MADYTNFINQTGLNPFTGEKVNEGTALMANHFQTVRGLSQTSAVISAAVGVFSEMVVKESASLTPNYREQILKNIEESKAARNSSKFNKYLEIESKTKTKISEQVDFADDIKTIDKLDDLVDASKIGSKVDTLLDGLLETTNRKGVARNFESTGGVRKTFSDFESLSPKNVRKIQTKYGPGKVGTLSDGSIVVARPGSKTGGATLEIKISNKKVYKIRY